MKPRLRPVRLCKRCGALVAPGFNSFCSVDCMFKGAAK